MPIPIAQRASSLGPTPSLRLQPSASPRNPKPTMSEAEFQALLDEYVAAHKKKKEVLHALLDAIDKLQERLNDAIGPAQPVHIRFRRARAMVEGLCEAGIALSYDPDLQAALQAGAKRRSLRRKPTG